MAKATKQLYELAGHEVALSNPDKVYFAKAAITKRELVEYYLAVEEGVLRTLARRPMILKRYVDGAEGEPFYQKRAPVKRPPWLDIATFKSSSPAPRTSRCRARDVQTITGDRWTRTARVRPMHHRVRETRSFP